MQPTQRFKKTLLAGALILGTCNAFNASADLFPVTAGAIPDVTAAPIAGNTEVSFSTGVIGNKVGFSCDMQGISGVDEDILMLDIAPLGANTTTIDAGALSGDACVTGGTGVPMMIEIEGSTGSTVSVTVADVVGAGYTYTPTSESCVVDFDGGNDVQDTCVSLASNTVTGIGMSGTQADGVEAATVNEIPDTAIGYTAIVGKTRMILAGSISIDSEIAAGTSVADNIIVQVIYE